MLEILVCPDCQSPLQSIQKCGACGTVFPHVDGTPSLMPSKGATRTVSFSFTPDRSVSGARFDACFVYPGKRGACGPGLPFHLDLAHLNVLNSLPDGARILEIGCGGGQMRSFVKAKGHDYIGTDISKTRVFDTLQKHGGPDLLCDAHFLPLKSETFDVVYTAALTEHLASPFLVAQQVARVLKPGGYYLGNVSFLEVWHDDSYFHMTPLGVFETLTQADFDIHNIWPGEGYHGFRAVIGGGNKATRQLTFVGNAINFIYRYSNKARNLIKSRDNWSADRIDDAAKVAGAIDWIARKLFATTAPFDNAQLAESTPIR